MCVFFLYYKLLNVGVNYCVFGRGVVVCCIILLKFEILGLLFNCNNIILYVFKFCIEFVFYFFNCFVVDNMKI